MLTFSAKGKSQLGRILAIAVVAVLWLDPALGQAATHTVKRGETLGVIAKKYGLTASAIATHNGIANPNRVKVGQKLTIPAKTDTITYTIHKGDTLSTIAKKHKTTAAAIAKANGIKNPNTIQPGQKLKITIGTAKKTTKPGPAAIASLTLREINRPRIRRNRWKHIVIHHSADSNNSIRGMEHYHRRVRRMENGLAYHFVIGNGVKTSDGKIYVGDRWKRQIRGGHLASLALNEVAIGICLIGNFEKTLPTAKQRTSLKALVSHLRKRTGVPFSQVRTHRNINPKPTICPGRRFSLRNILST
ncbi:MAG: LysM peptidoglycan-binding domain-containing protein [Verrucomicrobiota bacterium]|jgi:LysM repeat protein|nr:LysM peptidoglycan-binding domain-containing protein [Verrucomicrobiota bacterium]MDP7292374.1 LysM peptidoglycan-binding domain-containing protein [Verrucomicrobiota bacterium]